MTGSTAGHHASRGYALGIVGGMMLTFDVPLIRLGNGDIWSVMLVRSPSIFIAGIAAWAAYRMVSGKKVPLVPGRTGWLVGAFYAISSLTFLGAVHMTPTANLMLILALNPMITALLGWFFLRERPRVPTLVAIAGMFAAVAVIAHDGLSAGHTAGDALAFAATVAIACAITLTRKSGRDMGFVSIVAAGSIFPGALAMVLLNGFTLAEPGWILLDGVVAIPVAFFCLALAPRYLPGPEVAMFFLLETILAPIWVWLIFQEAPTARIMAAGAFMVVILTLHTAWQISTTRRVRPYAPRHPA